MKLLKIGVIDCHMMSWDDGTGFFDDIIFIKLKSLEKRKEGYNYIEIDDVSYLIRFIKRCIFHFNKDRMGTWIVDMLFLILRIRYRTILKKISNLEYDEVLVSYNDFDCSGFLLKLIYPALDHKIRITRSYKEARPQYDYLEKRSFELADRIVLNHEECVGFFQRKYGDDIFEGKEMVLGWDEDVPCTKIKNGIIWEEKISATDNKKHMVILAGRVFSSSDDKRSGSRLYYIDLIKKFLSHGFKVHLHTLKIFEDKEGVNQYEALQKEYENDFFIETPLNLQGDGWLDSYRILGRYDYGIIHNFIDGTDNSEFDKYNIAHRYYDYLLAHVIPVIPRGKSVVLEDIIKRDNSGIIYDSPDDIIKFHGNINFETRTFSDYLNRLFSK